MPIYEYKCKHCGKKIELFQKLDELPPMCECGAGEMSKEISLSTFILKGTGWYKTDYKNKK